MEGREYWWVKNPASCKKENVGSDQWNGLAKPSFDEETETQRGNSLAFSFTADRWHSRSQGLLHVSHHTWDIRYAVCAVLFSYVPGPWQSFLHHLSNRLTMITWLAIYTQHHAYWLPRILYPLIVHICNLKGPKRASWQLEPLGTMQGAGYPNLFKSYLEISCFTSSCLMSYLFLAWPFLNSGKR